MPAWLVGPLAAVDREHLRHPQRPAWAGTPRRPHPGRRGCPGRATLARSGRGDLVELGDRCARQALPGRLRPLMPQPPNRKQSSSVAAMTRRTASMRLLAEVAALARIDELAGPHVAGGKGAVAPPDQASHRGERRRRMTDHT